ncbi:hypothetical protein DL240_18065 [Lujinxingia litoralis]|uniref:DUF3108 domain-containing protein n=1 Tax=Lujinxingia litoralis TaxID=2211119 RepID=A0A328C2Z7_9DELT|nr:DUF3108 domain-containing protein [Lujinxingia litoralis]RAL20285.1 hypothetical protein DL240_18065 [Lujinxingia litoralis]
MRARRGAVIAALALVAFWALPGGLAEAGEPETGEQARYRVSYGPAHLADLSLEVRCLEGARAQGRLFAKSRGMASQVHPFRVQLDTLREEGGAALRAQTFIEERGEPRRYRSRFVREPRVRTEWEFRGVTRREQARLPGHGHDLLSWMLRLREEVAGQGELQGRRRFVVWDGWKLVYLDVTPGRVEERWTEVGALRAQRFALSRTFLNHEAEQAPRPAGQSVQALGAIWIELAPRALPVEMAFEAPIGEVRIEVQAHQGQGCHPAGDSRRAGRD